uniref:Uncharacterized protein n=1 Tax=Trichogramma kaykai TaxID=54128 RepID=A0ABD2X1F5_9HYME
MLDVNRYLQNKFSNDAMPNCGAGAVYNTNTRRSSKRKTTLWIHKPEIILLVAVGSRQALVTFDFAKVTQAITSGAVARLELRCTFRDTRAHTHTHIHTRLCGIHLRTYAPVHTYSFE